MPQRGIFLRIMIELIETINPVGRYHNPRITDGAFVVSQLLEDEEAGYLLHVKNEGLLQLSLAGAAVSLFNVYGIEVLRMNFGDLAESGIYGEERFTVLDTLHPLSQSLNLANFTHF